MPLLSSNMTRALAHRLLPIVLFSLLNIHLLAQSCGGNLGENLFVDGDFGSGSANILQMNPGIAPGFTYVLTGPPDDGDYTITNNTGAWTRNFPVWLNIRDNSTDPNGYMMIVNASFAPGLFYEKTIEGLCDNTDYEFSADIINLIQTNAVQPHIKPNVTFLIDGQSTFTTGEVPQSERWNTYAFSFSTAPDQTSVTLALRNNAPGGIGNDLGLDNISFRPCGPLAQILPIEQEVACEDGEPITLTATIQGDQYTTPSLQWQQSFDRGATWQNLPGQTALSFTHTDLRSGFYYYRYLLANGSSNLSNAKCRVVSNEKVIFVQPKLYTQQDTICEGLSYSIGSSVYEASGIYTDTLISFYGCDSIVTTDLTVVEDTDIQTQVSAQDPSCSYLSDGQIQATAPTGGAPPLSYSINDSSIFNGQLITNLGTGSYTYLIEDRYGCTFEEVVSFLDIAPYEIGLGPDLIIELGDEASIRLQEFGGVAQSITWTPAEAVVCDPPCTDFILLPSNDIQLIAEATNQNGCLAVDSILIEVLKVRKYYFPTAFSPNEDGVNDRFTGFGASPNVQLIEQLIVADRWGNVLFNRINLLPNDELSGWDGRSNGKPLDEGVYVFSSRIRYLDGVVEQISGEFSLIR